MKTAERKLARLVGEIRGCRVCVEAPIGAPLPHEPNPVLRPSTTARVCICSQAPGVRVHVSGKPFTDPSGDRLRAWLGVTPEEFYDQRRIAIVPMGCCFPGHDAAGGDLPPRRECAPLWQDRLFAAMPQLELILAVGSYAQHWHLPDATKAGMTATVARWRAQLDQAQRPRRVALPHPSWRNNAWLKVNPWFERDLLPRLRREMRALM
jgi:uracil-DNA glycosylase